MSMEELDNLLNDLGKEMTPNTTKVDFTNIGDLVDSPNTSADRLKNRLKERRISRRVSKKPVTQMGNQRLTSGLEDLDTLMQELGGNDSPAASRKLSNAQIPNKPVHTQSKVSGLDDLDDIIATLDLGLDLPANEQAAVRPQSTAYPSTNSRPQSTSYQQGTNSIPNVTGPSRSPSISYPVGRGVSPETRNSLAAPINPIGNGPLPVTAGRASFSQENTPNSLGQGGGAPIRGGVSKGTCTSCSQPIYDQILQALGGTYHQKCFACGGCGTSLGNGSFFNVDGVANCQSCYSLLFCTRCAHCDNPIQGSCMDALGKKWHTTCFICTQCLTPFGNSMFYERDGMPFCQGCFSGMFSSRCGGCSGPVVGEAINACGKAWHPEHFVCTVCRKAFGNTPYFDHNGMPYCQVHYHAQLGTVCGCGCGRAVMGRVVQAFGKQWLPEHFVCGFCMNPLSGGKFTERDGKGYCDICFKKLFVS
eukprot:TRINITY_DN4591_c0_g1_i1.p1 TRINITY_DN4591_c0_g1~~TRINITY_DN4591_c0_g1_i1.p1  ORF type:complete len:475 (+),score=30.47 TRINITY_DN4591_c0_g1_i1:73-1497(+)